MVYSAEIPNPNNPLSLARKLLKDAYCLEGEPLKYGGFLSVDVVKLLRPDFPEYIENNDLSEAISKQELDAKSIPPTTMLARLAFKVMDKFDERFGPPQPEHELFILPGFTTRSRGISGPPKWTEPSSPWVWLNVEEISYEGSISVDGQEFNFDPALPLIRASSSWLNNDGFGVAVGITYNFSPTTGLTTCNTPLTEIKNMFAVNQDATNEDNITSIINEAYSISNR